jgi:hypothetical protein
MAFSVARLPLLQLQRFHHHARAGRREAVWIDEPLPSDPVRFQIRKERLSEARLGCSGGTHCGLS